MTCKINLAEVPATNKLRDDIILYSESQGRFLVTINPANQDKINSIFSTLPCSCIGSTGGSLFEITGTGGRDIIRSDISDIEYHYKRRLKKY